MNSPLEYILVGIVTVAVLVYLVLALIMPEKFYCRFQTSEVNLCL